MKEILTFLSELAKHNSREWMTENKKYYLSNKKVFESIISQLIEGISKFDPEVSGLTPKDCTFRINRDIRFSRDKSPYKTNFGAAITPGGKKSPQPTYYFHLEPGNAFLAGGVYMPQPQELGKIRQEIDYNAEELKKIAESTSFRETWGEITGEELKTCPKGYPKDHPNIDLIRKKSFIVMHPLDRRLLISESFIEQAVEKYASLYPFNQYLSVAIS
ncbi:MAG: DUF2461 domain-containing protein [Cyclobacteriaceae bacterium]